MGKGVNYRCLVSRTVMFIAIAVLTIVLLCYDLIVGFGSIPLLNMVHSYHYRSTKMTTTARHDNQGSVEHGYVVAMRYSGQQGTGIQALMSLQCFLGSFNLSMYILEPVMNETSFGSFIDMDTKSVSNSLIKFSDMFDIAHFNNASRSMEFAELRSQAEFYTNAPRVVILVESSRSGAHPVSLVWTSQEKVKCYADQHVPKGFCVMRVISVSGKEDMLSSYQIFSKEELLQIVFGPWLPKDVTLIFRQWHTPWYVSNPSLENPFKCRDIRSITTATQFHTSPKLMEDAKRYEAQFLDSRNKVAIMFRLERMMIYLNTMKKQKRLENIDTYISKCIHEVIRIMEDTFKKEGGFFRPLVTLDMGQFGSISWRHRNVLKLTQQTNSTLSFLFQNKWTFSEWEESFTQVASIPNNSGYIAALERTLASRADCLVLVGGGYFQELALNDYKRNHSDKSTWCIHLICAVNSDRLKNKIDNNVIDILQF